MIQGQVDVVNGRAVSTLLYNESQQIELTEFGLYNTYMSYTLFIRYQKNRSDQNNDRWSSRMARPIVVVCVVYTKSRKIYKKEAKYLIIY